MVVDVRIVCIAAADIAWSDRGRVVDSLPKRNVKRPKRANTAPCSISPGGKIMKGFK
jgi:hypothetical protein